EAGDCLNQPVYELIAVAQILRGHDLVEVNQAARVAAACEQGGGRRSHATAVGKDEPAGWLRRGRGGREGRTLVPTHRIKPIGTPDGTRSERVRRQKF